eukprot:3276947-Pleurochrysis_carterae.AAC.2
MLLQACCKADLEEQLYALLASMRELHVVPNAVTMHVLASKQSANNPRLEQALAAIRDAS